jgi:hypothetical protein
VRPCCRHERPLADPGIAGPSLPRDEAAALSIALPDVASGAPGARPIALLTQHGKEAVLAPLLEPVLGGAIVRVGGYDTDRLGTFTREIPRAGTQLAAARSKARLGMELSGLRRGLGSEGAFGTDPMLGLLPWNIEMLVYLEPERGLELVGVAEGPSDAIQRTVDDWAALEGLARAAGFPQHGLVLRPDDADDPRIRKEAADWPSLQAAFAAAMGEAADGRVFVESDLRAHRNPARQARIREAAENLAARYASVCPACASPGFWQVERIPGLPCADCGAPTREAIASELGCAACGHREQRPLTAARVADPGRCDVCNP